MTKASKIRLFDLSLSQAESLFCVSRRTFYSNIFPQLKEGYHYYVQKEGRYNIKLFSSERLKEWQQIKHDPEKLRAAIDAWRQSLPPCQEVEV